MDQRTVTSIIVGLSFALYIAVAIGCVPAADGMSAAFFISMADLIAFLGYGGFGCLMGWADSLCERTLLRSSW